MFEVYVVHIGTSVLFSGPKVACDQYKDNQTFKTDRWKVSSLESYGESCYSDGNDEGYEQGYEAGSENG